MPPSLFSQSFRPTYPGAKTLSSAVLWDYVLTLQVDHETTLGLVVNDTTSETRRVGPVVSPETVVVTALHALHAQSVNVDLDGLAFSHPLRPFVQNDGHIEIGGSRATLAAHISALLHDLTADSPFASHELSLECRYSHPAAGQQVLLPILLVTREDVANASMASLAEQCAAAIEEWRTMTQPHAEAASLVFSVTFWPIDIPDAAPLLRLTNVVLAISDVA